MAWRKVTEADLARSLSQDEIDAFRSTSVEGDPIARQIADAVAYVRGCIRSGGARVRMSADEGALPESLVSPTMDYLRFGVLTLCAIEVNQSRTLAYNKAMELFEQLRAGTYIPESDGMDGEDDPSTKATMPESAHPQPPRLLD